jgi:phage terminase large subunit-like protein
MTIDPRGKDDVKVGNDYVGITVNFITPDNIWHFMSYREKLSATSMIDLMFTNWSRYRLRKIGIEDNQFTQGLLVSIREEMKKRGVYMDIVLLKTGGVQKELRIEGLVPRYEHGGIVHLTYGGKNQCIDLENELKLFPKAANDDTSDSAAYQLQVPNNVGNAAAGVVTILPPEEARMQSFMVSNGNTVGYNVNMKRALQRSEQDY